MTFLTLNFKSAVLINLWVVSLPFSTAADYETDFAVTLSESTISASFLFPVVLQAVKDKNSPSPKMIFCVCI